ncbi:tryptophan 7-halogenase [Sphingomonas sp. AP4-R1]|uniref:tryptophan halogenase family protein n=1 Tax=Sphingomonas sp. AP4-R1 TaxID=2735134 RepID=UPI001493506A|nr:tryptophan halogenase family protein [Sphingomonas sp. AP4-R1]QJU59122.1 tryptophan 7-halogenase [Sphingomonas sp. AP4-R1]
MPKVMKRVVIAGGGTAGWITAAALSKQLGPLLDITLVESDEIGTIGVGESTIPTARTFHGLIGINEQAFMAETGAAFKLGISFEHWARIGDMYFHAFGEIGKSTWMGPFHHFWLQARERGIGGSLDDYSYELKAAEQRRFATYEGSPIGYAYHLDAGLYARYLRKEAETSAMRRIEGKIQKVEQDGESGHITGLVLESGQRIEGDLFIDCTGFRGLLIEQTLAAGYEDWSHWLPNDSAIASQTRSVEPAVPYTRAIAHGAGWEWRIPLQHRVGNGLVYSSRHLTDDEAHARFRERMEGEILIEPKLIRFRTGRRRDVWVKNCIALGLAGGFVEPLESTSIHMIMIAVIRLLQLFPFGDDQPVLARRFNDLAEREIEGIRDFVIMHYKLTERDDTAYWRACRDMAIPDTLRARLDLFRESGHAYQTPDELFRLDSWVQVMFGQRWVPQSYHHMAAIMDTARLEEALGDLRRGIVQAVAKLPTQQAFLDSYCRADPAIASVR